MNKKNRSQKTILKEFKERVRILPNKSFRELFPYLKFRDLPVLKLRPGTCVVYCRHEFMHTGIFKSYWTMLQINEGFRRSKYNYYRMYSCKSIGYFDDNGKPIQYEEKSRNRISSGVYDSEYFITYINKRDKNRVCPHCPFRFKCWSE